MWIICIILIFSAPSFYLATSQNKKFEEILPITTLSIILILYILGLLEFLKYGVFIIYILTILFYILGIVKTLKKKNIKETIENMITPAYILFLILFVFICTINYDKVYSMWDDFSHWGTAIKSMYYLDALSTNPASNLVFASYPQATGLFEYFFMKVRGTYVEGVAIIAYSMLIINILIGFIKQTKWDNLKEFYIYAIFILGLPSILFFWHYSSLVVDSALGILFGCSIALVFLKEKWNKINTIQFILMLFTLCLIKDVGFQLALITIIYMIVDFVVSNKGIIKNKTYKNKEVLKWAGVIILTILVILATKISWQQKIEMTKTNKIFQEKIDVKEVIRSFKGTSQYEYRNKTVKMFFNKVIDTKVIKTEYSFNSRLILIALLILSYIIYKKIENNRQNKKRYLSMMIVVLLGFVVYAVGLLIIYLFRFGEAEALKYASFARYVGIYYYGILTIFTILFIRKDDIFKKTQKNDIKENILLFAILLFLSYRFIITLSTNSGLRNIDKNNINIDSRKKISEKAQRIKQAISKSEGKTYIVCQTVKNTNYLFNHGYIYWVLRQEIWPYTTNEKHKTNFGEMVRADDGYTYTENTDSWNKEILNYKYIYVYRTDQKFNNSYGKIFGQTEIKNDTLYIINKTGESIEIKEVD